MYAEIKDLKLFNINILYSLCNVKIQNKELLHPFSFTLMKKIFVNIV
jgi:hypothetical protein